MVNLGKSFTKSNFRGTNVFHLGCTFNLPCKLILHYCCNSIETNKVLGKSSSRRKKVWRCPPLLGEGKKQKATKTKCWGWTQRDHAFPSSGVFGFCWASWDCNWCKWAVTSWSQNEAVQVSGTNVVRYDRFMTDNGGFAWQLAWCKCFYRIWIK